MIKYSTIVIFIAVALGSLKLTNTYAQTYTPPQKVNPINSIIKESSGLQWISTDNSLWTFNDSGGDPAIYRIDTATDAILQTVNLGGATNVDWEDIAFDGTYLYVGDFGNNYSGGRNDLKIYKFLFSIIPAYTTNPVVTIDASQIATINFSYKNHYPLTDTISNKTRYDCETMLVDNGQIHLFTKNWIDLTSTHYTINSLMPGNYIADSIETLNTGYLVTAADKSPTTNTVLLLGYQNSGLGNHFIHVLTNYNNGRYFNGTVRQISLPNAIYMGQSEGITFRTDKYGYISNERFIYSGITFAKEQLHSFNVNDFPGQTVLPLQLLSFQAINTNNTIQLAWNFDTPVSQLQLQKSLGDANSFTTIKTYDTSKASFYNDQATTTDTYYRLVWSNGNGGFLYSPIVSAKSTISNSLTNVHLKQNGEFNFMLTGNATNYAIQLIDVNGRIINKIATDNYFVGYNSINLKTGLISNQIVFVTLSNNSSTITKKILVEN